MERLPSQHESLGLEKYNELSRPILIGWKERLDFVGWPFQRVKVKIDTGARTSAVGVVRYELEPRTGKSWWVRMHLALDRRHPQRMFEVEAPLLSMVKVRNTSGLSEQRPLIETEIRLGPVHKNIRLTVANRLGMCHSIILGREALEGDFLVDASRKFLLRS